MVPTFSLSWSDNTGQLIAPIIWSLANSDGDLTSIIDFYKEKGYRDARILLDTVKIDGNLIDLDIDFYSFP